MKRLPRSLLLVWVLSQGVGVPGCNSEKKCTPPEQLYICIASAEMKPGACALICSDGGFAKVLVNDPRVCAVNKADAAEKAPAEFAKNNPQYDLKEILECGLVSESPRVGPGYDPQTISPSCDPDPADDACISCAKSACCDQYQACAGDTLCLCWVECNYEGNPDDVCAQPDHCGPLDDVSASASECIHTNCPSACGGMVGMAGACMCGPPGGGSTSSSSSGGGCTPGPTGSGEPCFSDGDCASCICDPETMTCG
jgi:hypothetical protein